MFQAWLSEARDRFARNTWRKTLLGLRTNPAVAVFEREGIEASLIGAYSRLAETGQVVWCAIAQANPNSCRAGTMEFGANVVFGLDPYFESHPHHLAQIARRVFKLKGTYPDDPVEKKAAAVISDEQNFVMNWRLPFALTDGHEVSFTSVMLHRSRLPRGVLGTWLLPLVVAPHASRVSMLAPLACWPAAMRRGDEAVNEVLQSAPPLSLKPVSPQQLEDDARRAREVPHKPPSANDLVPGASRQVITLTDTCARLIREAAHANNLGSQWHVRVGGTDDARTFDLSSESIPADHEVIDSNGIKVAIPRRVLPQVRGCVVDYRETAVGAGFVFVDR